MPVVAACSPLIAPYRTSYRTSQGSGPSPIPTTAAFKRLNSSAAVAVGATVSMDAVTDPPLSPSGRIVCLGPTCLVLFAMCA